LNKFLGILRVSRFIEDLLRTAKEFKIEVEDWLKKNHPEIYQ